ncbi:DUF4395 domain-containing protein [Nocardioides dubius]|uniref:DUF4395 domain-containing protein n=1 Tax=Nocardioides dubius TaxID=317019 RepID=A0ABN1U3D2_9ACTN
MSEQQGIDPRGPRFAAGVTSVVLAVVLLTAPHPAGVALLAVQALLFASGALLGLGRTPLGWLYRRVVRPRLAPPVELEDPAPPRFAQSVGLAFAVVALVGYLAGLETLGAIAVGFALAAALLNAVIGFCLGCEMYLLGKRFAARAPAPAR